MTDMIVDEDWPIDSLIIQVESRLLQVPRRVFAGSPIFRDMFAMPQAVDATVDGSDREHPLKLDQVSLSDFELFMRATMPDLINTGGPRMSVTEWTSVLSLVTMWQMDAYRDEILDIMTPMFTIKSGALQIHIARTYNIKQWILPGISKLVNSPSPLTVGDMKLLGLELSAKISEIREKNKVEAAISKTRVQTKAEAEEAWSKLHREIYDAWDIKCECRANKWCKKTAPKKDESKASLVPTSLLMTEDMLIMSLRVQALAREYEKMVGDGMGKSPCVHETIVQS